MTGLGVLSMKSKLHTKLNGIQKEALNQCHRQASKTQKNLGKDERMIKKIIIHLIRLFFIVPFDLIMDFLYWLFDSSEKERLFALENGHYRNTIKRRIYLNLLDMDSWIMTKAYAFYDKLHMVKVEEEPPGLWKNKTSDEIRADLNKTTDEIRSNK